MQKSSNNQPQKKPQEDIEVFFETGIFSEFLHPVACAAFTSRVCILIVYIT